MEHKRIDTKIKREELERKITEGFDLARAALIALSRLSHDIADGDRVPHPRWGFPTRRLAAEKAAAGEIPAAKVGRTWFATRADLDAYFAQHAPVGKVDAKPDLLSAVDVAMKRGRR